MEKDIMKLIKEYKDDLYCEYKSIVRDSNYTDYYKDMLYSQVIILDDLISFLECY